MSEPTPTAGHQRNTRQAPTLRRCDTRGASDVDGNGKVRNLHGIPLCGQCRQGARELVRDEPDNYAFGPDGRLSYIGPIREDQVAAAANVDQLLAAAIDATQRLDRVSVEVFHPQSGVAIVLPEGYRWHLYIPKMDPTASGMVTARLFTSGREIVTSLPLQFLGKLTSEFLPEQIVALLLLTYAPGSEFLSAIENDLLARLEISLFDVDDLLPPSDGV